MSQMFTTSSLRRRVVLAVPAAVVTAAMLGTPAVAAVPDPAGPVVAPAPTTLNPSAQGIIMRDGGICDPIRWGC
jgi:hypothetical protein